MECIPRWWYNKLVMNQVKSQTLLQAFFSVFKQAIVTVGRHIYLILLPLGLDLFLLFGPKLGLSKLLNPLLVSLPAIENFEQQFSLSWEAFIARTMELVSQFNIFSALRTLPFGLPSLMSQRLVTASPFGASPQLELENYGSAFLAFLLISLVGIALGTAYFTLMAKAVQLEKTGESTLDRYIFFSYFNLVEINLLSWILAIVLSIPMVILLGLLLQLSAGLGYIAYMIGTIIILSFVIPLVFAPNFIIAQQLNFIKAAVKSVLFTRRSGILASFFIILCISASYLTNMLWNSAPDTSPFILVGVFGHALVTTILLTASFHFMNLFEISEVGQKPQIV